MLNLQRGSIFARFCRKTLCAIYVGKLFNINVVKKEPHHKKVKLNTCLKGYQQINLNVLQQCGHFLFGIWFYMRHEISRLVFHCEFLEYWITQKSVWRIWQHFLCLLDEGIPKIWKKLNSHDGFLSYLQNSIANSAHLAAHFCPALVCPQKATVKIQFLPYFWNPLIK